MRMRSRRCSRILQTRAARWKLRHLRQHERSPWTKHHSTTLPSRLKLFNRRSLAVDGRVVCSQHWAKLTRMSTSLSVMLDCHDIINSVLFQRSSPTPGCRREYKNEKEKRRHVWKTYRNWAMQVQYPCIRGPCDICGKSFTCQDYVVRYRREEYEDQKKKKKEKPHVIGCNIDLRCITSK